MIKFYNILVPIDGSDNAKLAFNRAIFFARRHPAVLHLIHIINFLTNTASADAEFMGTAAKIDQKKLRHYQQTANQYGIKTDTKIYYGSPKMIIANKLPKKDHINLIIMGSNGLTPVERVLMGSVAVYVSREAPCNVLLVKENQKKKV